MDPRDRTQQPIVTERLILRSFRPADAAVLHELWGERDPRVPPHRRLDADGRPTTTDQEDWIRAYEGEPAPGLLAVVLQRSDDVIGYCGLVPNSIGGQEPELAFEFLRAHWNQGYATEAARAVVDRAAVLGHGRLASTVRAWNTASLRVLEKLGFTDTSEVEPDPVHGDSLLLVRAN